MELGDGGDLSILIRYDDLAAGRYDRLATDISMNYPPVRKTVALAASSECSTRAGAA